MTSITFDTPKTCESCKATNFKIVGTIYNDPYHYMNMKIRCMKCGEIHETINQPIT